MSKGRRKKAIAVAALQAMVFAPQALGQTTATWLTAADGTWQDPAAWSSNPAYPNNGFLGTGDTYDAIIAATGASYTVSDISDVTVHSLTLNSASATLDQSSSTLTLNNGGSIGAGIYKIENGTLNLSGMLSNAGTITLTNGTIAFSGGTFNNLASGVVNVSPPDGTVFSPFLGAPNSGVVVNAGTININGPTGIIGFINYPMISSGTFSANSGSVQFANGTYTWNTGAVITGAGYVDLGSTFANHVLNGNLTVSGSNVVMSGGTISGLEDLNETAGSFTWRGGTISATSGVGLVNVSAGATFNAGSNTTTMTLSRVLNNSGTMNFFGGSISLAAGTINNLSGGVVNIGVPVGQYAPFQITSGSSAFNNAGTINVNTVGFVGGGPSQATTTLNGGLNDSGTIIVNAGTLLVGNVSGIGSITYGSGAVFKGTSTIDFGKGAGTQTVNGNLTLAGSTMILDNGTFTGPGNIEVPGSLSWNGGTFAGTGTMAVATGGSLSVSSFTTHGLSRVLSNSGTVIFGAGSIALNSGTFINTANGVVNIVGSPQLVQYTPYSAFSGTSQFNNAGTMNINVGSNTGVQLPGPFVDSGTIAVNSGSVSFSGGSYTWNGNATVMGAGTVEFGPFSSNTHVVNGDLTLAGTKMSLSNGTFSGPGNIEITGNLIWNNGSISGSGTVAVGTTGVVSSGSFGARTLSRLLTNFGVFNFGGATLSLNGGTFVNAAGGTVNFNTPQTGTQNAYLAFSGSTGFNNSGWMNIGPSGSTTLLISNPFVDYGTISANSGTLAFGFGTFIWNGSPVLTGASSIELGFNTNNHIINGNLTMAGTKMSMGNGSFSGPGNENVTGVFNWNGGAFMGTGALNVMPGAAINFGQADNGRFLSQLLNNSGTATFTSAVLMLGTGTFNNGPGGTVNITSPGTQTLFATGSVGPNLIKNAGTISVAIGAATMQSPFVNTGSVTVIANGALNTMAGLTNAGTIDLSGILTVGYSGPSVLPTIEQQIISGLNGGIWKGIGIDSSSAASVAADVNNPHKTGIGYAEASALGIVGTGTFAGQAVTDHTVIARYTYLGDANLDQTVNLLDLNAVATNFGQSGKVWTDGDTNYDGVVNMLDFNNVAMNYGNTLPLPPGGPALGALVPEPVVGILLEIAAIAWVGGRKRRICFTSQPAVH